MVTVTVGICVHNGANTVTQAISSIVDQEFPHNELELLIVDDGSDDDTLNVIRDYTSQLDFTVKIYHTCWRGLGPARNLIVNNASGKYLVWVDCDIILPKTHIRQQVELMNNDSCIGIAGGTYGLLKQNGLVAYLDNLAYTVYGSKTKRRNKSGNLPGTGGSISRINALRQIGGFDENIKGSGEDIDVAYRVKSAGWLVLRDNALFYARSKSSWKKLWRHYYWHGYGAHYVLHKDVGIASLVMMSPFITLISSVFSSISAYKIAKTKVVFFLPFHALFKNIAWWFGYCAGRANNNFPIK